MAVLQCVAKARSQSAESIAREWMQSRGEKRHWENDPFWQACGGVEGAPAADLARNHDFYLGAEAMEPHEAT